MDYEIYFHESNKLDPPGKDYSYYGAFGIDSPTVSTIQEEMEYIFSSLHTKSELHFNNSTFAAQNRQVHLNIIGQTRKPLL